VRARFERRKAPCMACGRVVAVAVQIQNHGGGKARARHKCPHGEWCITGDPLMKAGGWNYARCAECRREAIAKEGRDV
jgi:hypothetical protein